MKRHASPSRTLRRLRSPAALIGLGALIALALAAVFTSPTYPGVAHAQTAPSVAVELCADSVTPGTAITATMSFGGLAFDSDKATKDYIFRADVLDSDNGDADECEDWNNGYGLGVERYMWKVD